MSCQKVINLTPQVATYCNLEEGHTGKCRILRTVSDNLVAQREEVDRIELAEEAKDKAKAKFKAE